MEMKPAFGYMRVSGAGQLDGDGEARQRQAIESFALRNGFVIIRWFFDGAVSGEVKVEDRAQFEEMVNLCGESFLLVTRDGDLTPAFARSAIDLEIETEASHLVIVATGRLHNEAGLLLHTHAGRRVSGGRDFQTIQCR